MGAAHTQEASTKCQKNADAQRFSQRYRPRPSGGSRGGARDRTCGYRPTHSAAQPAGVRGRLARSLARRGIGHSWGRSRCLGLVQGASCRRMASRRSPHAAHRTLRIHRPRRAQLARAQKESKSTARQSRAPSGASSVARSRGSIGRPPSCTTSIAMFARANTRTCTKLSTTR